ncbi:MAG TPA: hypothetical protein VLT47_14625 [Anaeromyxobacteraceae bacterium]|nr:hypothetical protein [Anaeromyxobacteraceae bacterium]
MDDRSRRLLFRILPLAPAILILALVVVAAAASSAARGPDAGACEPRTWRDWHVAVKSQCVQRTWVCGNMTPAKLLQDPEVAAAYEDALATNDRDRIAEMDGLIAEIREAYGCPAVRERMPPAGAGASAPDARDLHELPAGHPPVHALPPGDAVEPRLDRTI